MQVTHTDGDVQWDQRGNLYKGNGKNAAEVDKPIAGFLTDLKSRGLLDDTLVLLGGEFGRTPTAQSGDGRDHNPPRGFTMWMAGGGVKGGIAHGSTDDLALGRRFYPTISASAHFSSLRPIPPAPRRFILPSWSNRK